MATMHLLKKIQNGVYQMKSRWIKLCSILLVLTMLINMLPVHALALDSEDRGSASVQGDTESHTVQIIGEVDRCVLCSAKSARKQVVQNTVLPTVL